MILTGTPAGVGPLQCRRSRGGGDRGDRGVERIAWRDSDIRPCTLPKHRQDAAALASPQIRSQDMWHRHSCLCWCRPGTPENLSRLATGLNTLRDDLLRLFPRLRDLPTHAYVVGGAVRDLTSALAPADVDVACLDPLACARALRPQGHPPRPRRTSQRLSRRRRPARLRFRRAARRQHRRRSRAPRFHHQRHGRRSRIGRAARSARRPRRPRSPPRAHGRRIEFR